MRNIVPQRSDQIRVTSLVEAIQRLRGRGRVHPLSNSCYSYTLGMSADGKLFCMTRFNVERREVEFIGLPFNKDNADRVVKETNKALAENSSSFEMVAALFSSLSEAPGLVSYTGR